MKNSGSASASIHTAIRVGRLASFVGLGLVLASQASRVYLRGVPIHTTTGVVSRVYSISDMLLVATIYATGHLMPRLYYKYSVKFTVPSTFQ